MFSHLSPPFLLILSTVNSVSHGPPKGLLMPFCSVYCLPSNASSVPVVIFQKIQLSFKNMDLIKALCCLTTSNTPAVEDGLQSRLTLLCCHPCWPLVPGSPSLHPSLHPASPQSFSQQCTCPAVSSGRNTHPCPSLFTGGIAACGGTSLPVLQLAPYFYHIMEPIIVCFSSVYVSSHLTAGSLKAGQ